ncbi:MAG: GreA/GreB family elongation factor, partial [Clostridia bacterium]|nr:GreA/GreB family elongation factor [Clostridia bacterium]
TTEADVEKKRISNESPIGGALLGRKVGEKVEIEIPAGKTTVVIKKIY